MKRWGMVVGAVALLGGTSVACGGKMGETEGVTEPPVGTNGCAARSGVDGVSCYPTTDIGQRPRSEVGINGYGNRLANLQFIGMRSTSASIPTPFDAPMTHVEMADYFDPKSSKYSLLVVNVCVRWCGPCNRMADEVQSLATVWEPSGIVFVQAISEGLDYKPAKLDDVRAWVGDHTANFTVVADSDERILGSFDVRPALPFLMYVDPRTMEIVAYETGEPQDIDGRFTRMRDQLRMLSPKP